MFRQLQARFGGPLAMAIVTLLGIWLIVMVTLPQLQMIEYSLRPNLLPAQVGGPDDRLTLTNYATLFSNDIHRSIFVKTIWSSVLVTLLTLAVSYPLAWYLP